ncbi:mannitol operon transcriptional antiterminator [Paenibacillus sophorae]|uniref:BglG family transcription antiterminator n=1 Tax=Paenibacillus sophorae TaxID=1333845 RepID=A0A1H8M200_9BACL|nr:BglG family transcription antiterminator [Paenibacillus sophorae]QWU17641.1 BglG family transcription antiterminator [Paenibacillus sophorae]SEO11339.1 mannitol operon transcriptional antiterminator [Paenibacillus sophorae]
MIRKITARQRQMIQLLLDNREEITAAEIAGNIGVSVRTVHREMEETEHILQDFGLTLSRKSGKGIQMNGPETGLGQLRHFLRAEKPAEYSGEERKIFELCSLIETEEPLKLFALAHTLKVTVATVSNDLDELEPWVRKFGLQLVRRRGYGVEIAGVEADKRRALCRLAAEHLDQSDLVGRGPQPEGEGSPVFRKLLAAVGQSRLLNVENILWDMEWNWTAELPESVYMELLLGLSVAVRRWEIGMIIRNSEDAAYSLMTDHRNISGAEQFVKRLENEMNFALPKTEHLYIAELFDRAQESSAPDDFVHGDIGLMGMVYRLTDQVVKRTGFSFHSDRILREGLLEHVEQALRRIREGTRIRNPLLGPIRKDYQYLFRIIRDAVDELKLDLAVPDEEIAFLVMHFGASTERLNQLKRNVRAILVCASGLSSSRLLGERLRKEMPQLEILGNVSWYEAARMPEEDYDLIISTIDLPMEKDRYIRISPLLTAEEIDKLLRYIQNKAPAEDGSSSAGEEDPPVTGESVIGRLRSYKGLLDEIDGLVERFRYYSLSNEGMDLQDTIGAMFDKLSGSGVTDDPETLRKRLLEREKMASQVIPDTSLALFHTRSSHVLMSSLTLYRLQSPLTLDGNTEVRTILLMLAPKVLSKESLEVLSEISAMMLDTDLMRLLEERSEQEIRTYLSAELLRFFENKK